jgi:hypothetical protein
MAPQQHDPKTGKPVPHRSDDKHDPKQDPKLNPGGPPDLTGSGKDFSPGSGDIKGTASDIRHAADETPRDEKGNKDGARSAVGHPPIGSGGVIPGDPNAEFGAGGIKSPSEMGAMASPDTGGPKHPPRPAPGEDDGSYDIDPDHPNRPGDPNPKIPKQEVNPATPERVPGDPR